MSSFSNFFPVFRIWVCLLHVQIVSRGFMPQYENVLWYGVQHYSFRVCMYDSQQFEEAKR
jgi:hypothetical protein